MERRYMVALLAMVATFAATSHGFRALQQMSVAYAHHSGAMAHSTFEPNCALRALAKIRTHLRPHYPEEAQLLAEMNVPFANLDTAMAERMAQRDAAVAQCARAEAMRNAERTRRDAERIQQSLASIGPMALQMNLPADLDQRINVALASSMAANHVKLQVLADKWRASSMRIQSLEPPVIDVTDDGGRISTHVHVHTRASCKTSRVTPDQPQPE